MSEGQHHAEEPGRSKRGPALDLLRFSRKALPGFREPETGQQLRLSQSTSRSVTDCSEGAVVIDSFRQSCEVAGHDSGSRLGPRAKYKAGSSAPV